MQIEDMKHMTASTLNQAKLQQDDLKESVNNAVKNNVLKFQRSNPASNLQSQWHIAAARQQFVFWMTLPYIILGEYARTWQEVYRAVPSNKEVS
jgi:hypothetical protein